MYGIKIGKENWVFPNANHFTRAVIDAYDYGYKLDDAFVQQVDKENSDDAIEFEEWLVDNKPEVGADGSREFRATAAIGRCRC